MRSWFVRNAVAHPAMALLELAESALRRASHACRDAAQRIHDGTVPDGDVDDYDLTDDDIVDAAAWADDMAPF